MSVFGEDVRWRRAEPEPNLEEEDSQKQSSKFQYVAMLVIFVLLTVADGVLNILLFDVFGESYSQFLNQGTAAVYGILSAAILMSRAVLPGADRGEATTRPFLESALRSTTAVAPWYVLVAIGLFNGTGNFLQAISQPHTSGLTQSVLSQLGIPLVLLLSYLLLQRSVSPAAALGAASIVLGTAASALASQGSGPVETFWYASLLFGLAQVLFSGERVFEEAALHS